MKRWIGIATGDVTGVGIEVTLKALSLLPKDEISYLLIGDEKRIRKANSQFGVGEALHSFTGWDSSERICIHQPGNAVPDEIAPGSAPAAEASIRYLEEGARFCLEQHLTALVTAPVNKESIIRSGRDSFTGQTEFLSDLAGARRTAMMLLGADDRGRWLRVALATTHVPIRSVADHLTEEKVLLAIELAEKACQLLKLPRSKVGVCGLNPHAGEGGKLGDEEITTIIPAVQAAIRKGIDVEGPFAADTLFHQVYHGAYDAVVAMYHDQGLAPMKMVAFDSGVNWTLGLPFIRTSPDHGTAYNIAGKGIASPGSMKTAIQLARQLAGV
ncbi:MAG: 4-hydroxythreonine-4-phosphate dehydrogenase PdxA [Verrucomicrobiota bacterium]|nr:4-hydroxythreonine-4-phosphate dehydrogenase PdxA [Verrucomicrobiota bacterium]